MNAHPPEKPNMKKNRYLVKFSNPIFYVTFSTALALLRHNAARFRTIRVKVQGISEKYPQVLVCGNFEPFVLKNQSSFKMNSKASSPG